ncbi:MAG TPA: ATP-binding protein [Bacteroidales bacterium]|nr:ATP-binding protein [Bacteroidales bacterium]HCI56053.1 ATP-binding protein [Bacteroidales bacterium]HOU95786.1 ATP-binding protein [Bacteroidales bacterium]HQG36571.1 ATP-binding protein [Bacteroidales bacterium]HQG52924.1 ATP-binding protein [Bacteroidales bacterium]
MDAYLKTLISRGENKKVDFKYCINDSKKIARTLSAFANTEGGTLLVGVRDNGSIAGVNSEEEYYMIDSAAKLYCKPEIPVVMKPHDVNRKTIIEVKVEKGLNRPYKAKGEDGKWRAYFRNDDQNLVANRILIKLWKYDMRKKGIMIRFGKSENILLNYLKENNSITLSAFRKLAEIPLYRAEKIIVNLLLADVLIMDASEKGYKYRLNCTE